MLKGGYVSDDTTPETAPEDWLNLGVLVGLEVLAESGDRIGQLADVHFDQDSLRVESYELSVPALERWFGGGGRISPDLVIACSRDLMIIRAARRVTEEETADARVPSGADVSGSAH
jgi:sporulation protein YlmC with PRC-barrel domain